MMFVVGLLGWLSLAAPAGYGMEDDKPADMKAIDAIVSKAMKAYNDADYKKFFADYAKAMSVLATEQTFNALYKTGAMPTYGKFKSMKFIEKVSVTKGDFLLINYEAEFEKKKAKLQVNFMKEDGVYRIQQLQINEWKKGND